MPVNTVVEQIDEAWQDAVSGWDDAMRHQFNQAVITNLKVCLDEMQAGRLRLISASEAALRALRAYDDTRVL